MNYMEISHCNMVNGEGLRTVLWVSGCSHNCPGCQNAYSQNPEVGVSFDEKALYEIYDDMIQDWCSGLTISGGDPLYCTNRKEVIKLCIDIKKKFPSKNIWVYTGYTYQEILNDETMNPILDYVDVIVDGEFKNELKDPQLHWRGSSNQNVIVVSEVYKKKKNKKFFKIF